MILGLTGPQRAGKTTVMDYLHSKHGFVRMSIAAEIKAEAHRMIGRVFGESEKDKPQAALNGKTPRDLYIYVGNLDEFDHSFWVNRMFRNQYEGSDTYHVIESVGKQFQYSEIVRYCEAGRDGVVLLDVSRPDHGYKDSRHSIRDSHPFLRIENNGDLAELYVQLDGLVAEKDKLFHRRTAHDVHAIVAIEKEVYGT